MRTAVEAIGLNKDVIDEYFTGTTSRVGGVGLDELAEEVAIRHRVAYPSQWTARPHRNLRTGGEYKWRRTGEDHLNDPEAIFLLQQSTQRGDYDMFKKYSAHINDTSNRLMTLRGLMKFKSGRKPIDISEVEPASEIVQAFLHRRHELWLHLPGGARDPRDRHEHHRRTFQLR